MVALGGLIAYASLTLPDISTIGKATGTIKLLDRNGQLIAEVGHQAQNQHNVTIDQIAPIMREATVAAEDRNFYNEGAFNPVRVLKAMVDDLILRRPAEGASTITQQLAKQAFFGADASKTVLRKVREALLANELDSKYTKDQILDQYLNITYYGENAYGVESAAMRYFGKPAVDLDLREASLLAGLPQAPSLYDPYKNPSGAYARMHYVLRSLVDTGKISQGQADAVDPLVGGANAGAAQADQQQANQTALRADLAKGSPASATGAAPHFVQYVQDELQQIFGSDDPRLLQGSLVVTTTLDLNLQKQANAAVAAGVAKMARQGANNGALLMIDARTGNIEAMVGSADFNNRAIAGEYNIVTAERRPGSSFKPYVYETGFIEHRFSPYSILDDTPQESRALGGVQDFDRRYQGRITATQALLQSRNIAAEQAMVMAGIPQVIDFAYKLGICRCTPLAENASTAIGTSAVRMIDHASAYAAFANGGHKVVARGILKVTDGNGNVLRDYTRAPDLGTVMTPAQAWTMTNILRNYASTWGLRFKWDTAGKSGTTDNFVDSYYMTYTPDWVVATWTGRTDGSNPAEQGTDGIYGTETGAMTAVPFVNGLPRPSAFVPVYEVPNCSPGATDAASAGLCPTPTPSPSPSPTPSPSPSPTPTESPTPVTFPPVVTPSPSSSASPSPSRSSSPSP